MTPISAIFYFDRDYTGDDCGENFEFANFVSMKFIPRISIEALLSKIKRKTIICLISDQGVGLLSAIESLGSRFRSPLVEHRYCLQHVASNYHGYELLPEKFVEMLEELKKKNSEGYDYIAGIPKEKRTNAYDGGFRYGHMTTNLAEAINSSLTGIRNFPITAIVKATYFRLGKLFATLGKESERDSSPRC
ncbi:hypothetical protein GQ457_12G030570 [Hibiscus cannabinus]